MLTFDEFVNGRNSINEAKFNSELNLADEINNLKKVKKLDYDFSIDLNLDTYFNKAGLTDEALAIEIQTNKVTPKLEKELNKILQSQTQSEEDEDGNPIWQFKSAVFSYSRTLTENESFLSLLFDGDEIGMNPDYRSEYEQACEIFLDSKFVSEMKNAQIKFNKSIPAADFDDDDY